MNFKDKSTAEFNRELSSGEPVPGGGGGAAMCGAMAASLGCMVCRLTIGKKKFLHFDRELREAEARLGILRDKMMSFADMDAEAFIPLAEAYKIPKDSPGRESVMEKALLGAAQVPMEIMRAGAECIDIFEYLLDHSSVMVISDVGVGAALASGAVKGAGLNIFINTKSMKNRDEADRLDYEAESILNKYIPLADSIFDRVTARLR